MTRQETYDILIAHMRQQGEPAIENSVCRYRCLDGKKCPAGALIPDELYSPTMEGAPLQTDYSQPFCGVTKVIHERGHDITLVRMFQQIHDHGTPSIWEREFRNVADVFGLTYCEVASCP